MKQFAVIISLALVVFTSCKKEIDADGPNVTENRAPGTFTGIDFRVHGLATFQVDSVYRVEVSTQQNIIHKLETYVSNGKLVVRFPDGYRVRNEFVHVKISAPALNSIRLSGSGQIMATGAIQAADVSLRVEGSGSLMVDRVVTNTLRSEIEGSGLIRVSQGTATNEQIRIEGSGNIELSDVVADRVSTRTSGSGNTKVHALQTLDVSITGSGNVYYRGNPAITSNITGSGSVIRL